MTVPYTGSLVFGVGVTVVPQVEAMVSRLRLVLSKEDFVSLFLLMDGSAEALWDSMAQEAEALCPEVFEGKHAS